MTPAGTRPRPRIFGILNVTPDSFSDGGNFFSAGAALEQARKLVADGADVIDVGGESTRPGAKRVGEAEELRRVLPVIAAIARDSAAMVSIDTVKSRVARAALDAGARVVNDVSGLTLDPEMAKVCADAGCEVVLMHSRGSVEEMASYELASYGDDPVGEIADELKLRISTAEAAGIDRARILIDPGIGFSKRSEHSLAVMAELARIVALGHPVLLGVSRKRVVAEVVVGAGASPEKLKKVSNRQRDIATVKLNVAAFLSGVSAFRVHNVRANRVALDQTWESVRES